MSLIFEKVIEVTSTVLLILLAIVIIEIFLFIMRKKILNKLFLQRIELLLMCVVTFSFMVHVNHLPLEESAGIQKLIMAIVPWICPSS